MNPLLSPDRPAEPTTQVARPGEQPPSVAAGPPPAGSPDAADGAAAARTCADCGAPMHAEQGWCLQCGAGAPGILRGASNWRPLAAVALAAAILVAGAAVAAAAALDQHKPTPRVAVTTVTAQTPAPAVTPSVSTPNTTPGGVLPSTPSTPGAGSTKSPSEGGAADKSLFTPSTSKPPKIPLNTPTPKSSTPTSATPQESNSETPTSTPPSKGTANPQPTPILLDTDAASVYNPYGYPEADFGDPSLAIDGDTTTAWTARLEPSVAPRMAEGLVIDLKSGHHLGRLEVHTATPGLTVEVYGAKGQSPPAAITDPGWIQLNPTHVLGQKTLLKLHDSTKQFRFVLLWLTQAPASSVGTPEAPGQVSVNELSLFASAP